MKAVIFTPGVPPAYGDFQDPEMVTDSYSVVTVNAAALTNLDMLIATGRHPFSPKAGAAVVGREAVVSTALGERLFLTTMAIPNPYGSMAQMAIANLALGIPVPTGISDVLAAALGNAGLAAWLPLSWRGRLAPGETVMVLGATGTSGRMAVAAAKLLGAKRVVAVGRNPAALQDLRDLGADAVVQLGEDLDIAAAFEQEAGEGIDVVLDYLGGEPAEAVFPVMKTGGRIVQIGAPLSPTFRLPAALARVRNLDILGFAYHHAPHDVLVAAFSTLCHAAKEGALPIKTESLPLSDFPIAWEARQRGSATRYVMLPNNDFA